MAGGGSTYGAAFGDGLSKSIDDRVAVAAHVVRDRLRQRDADARRPGAPSDSAGFDRHARQSGSSRSATTELATSPAATLRKSSSTVSGSGRVGDVYATGSVASMTSDAPFASTRALMVFSLHAGDRAARAGGRTR